MLLFFLLNCRCYSIAVGLFAQSPQGFLLNRRKGFVHNFGLAGSADSVSATGEYIVGGIKTNGQVAVLIALAALLVISLVHLHKKAK